MTPKVRPTLGCSLFIMNYSKEFKLECVMKYKNGEYIEDPPGVKHKSFHDQVLLWCRIYDERGEMG